MALVPNIAWTDTETTDLDENKGKITEIAIVVTRQDLSIVSTFNRVVHFNKFDFVEGAYDSFNSNPINALCLFTKEDVKRGRKNHISKWSMENFTRNGLLEEMHSSTYTFEQVVEDAIEFMRSMPNCLLGGFSPHFDRAWLRKHAPKLERCFSYRNFDVSTLLFYYSKLKNIEIKKDDVPHRALADCISAINKTKELLVIGE